MDNLQPNTCQECNKPLNGRVDKKFCDAYCRNSYNNKSKRENERLIIGVNQSIRRNRRILKELSPQGKTLVRRDVVESMGFNFNHFSSLYRSQSSYYYMSYDYGFRALIDNGKQKIQIIQIQNYMGSFDPWQHIKK
ncbi:MAG: hypothetical protein R8N23_04375 [Reichenbachiella sp.]|uniref:hypothetical protein n=1 Tax=Reichenbachiella sp. TaxID=2184521 RepID=UPI0029675043|nr:hypothetical protein [Reichenbachiella sp.]MDW3209077.1 hypothetical protein [Reichenbachiella sp.]